MYSKIIFKTSSKRTVALQGFICDTHMICNKPEDNLRKGRACGGSRSCFLFKSVLENERFLNNMDVLNFFCLFTLYLNWIGRFGSNVSTYVYIFFNFQNSQTTLYWPPLHCTMQCSLVAQLSFFNPLESQLKF